MDNRPSWTDGFSFQMFTSDLNLLSLLSCVNDTLDLLPGCSLSSFRDRSCGKCPWFLAAPARRWMSSWIHMLHICYPECRYCDLMVACPAHRTSSAGLFLAWKENPPLLLYLWFLTVLQKKSSIIQMKGLYSRRCHILQSLVAPWSDLWYWGYVEKNDLT